MESVSEQVAGAGSEPVTGAAGCTAQRRKDVGVPERKSVVFSDPEVNPSDSEANRGDPATSCITNITTSTTSIDGGYQGDSEYDTGTPNEDPSRPPPRLDVLTDSDFCSEGAAGTESEAEHRLTDVEMESSGVYSDAESRRSTEPEKEPIEAIEEAEESVLSPVKEVPSPAKSQASVSSTPSVSGATASASASASAAPSPAAASPLPSSRRRDPIPGHIVKPREPPPKKEPIKMNHPLPKRNVQSKLRSMLETPAAGAVAGAESRRAQRAPRKGRWDAVMSRIEQNKTEEKSRPKREVKSRLLEGVTLAKGAQSGSGRSLTSGRASRTESTHTLTGSRTSLRPPGSRSVSPTYSEVSSASSGSARSRGSRGSMNSRDSSSKVAGKTRNGSTSSLTTPRTYIPALRIKTGSAATTSRSGSKQSGSGSSRQVPAVAARAALESQTRRPASVLTNKTNIANNQGTAAKATKTTSRAPLNARSQNRVQNNNNNTAKDGKPASIKSGGPAAAAAARHEVKVTQLEEQLTNRQRELQVTRDDLQHATRCFDAAMVMVNYLANEYNPFQLTDELKALQSRATEIQLALDEAVAAQRRLQTELEEGEAARVQLVEQQGERLAELEAAHQQQLSCVTEQVEQVRSAWHQERQLMEQDLVLLQQQRDGELQQLSQQHQQQLSSVAEQWQQELAASQQRADTELAQLQELNQQLSHREEQLRAAMGQSTSTKVQVLSARNKELEKEVRSLNAVLDLKRGEIGDLRRDCSELQRLREETQRLQEQVTRHRAKAEDLEAQLRTRADIERQLSEENQRLREHHDKESKVNKRLSMENEQLQYKLRNPDLGGTPGILSRSASFRTSRTPTFIRACSESPHTPRVSPRSPLKSESLRRRSRRSEEPLSPPPSPQVTAVVEKSDSISWVLALDAGLPSSAAPSTNSTASSRASHGGSESSDSDGMDHETNGVFYHMTSSAPAALIGGQSAPASLVSSQTDHCMDDIPETLELGTEL